MNTIIDQINGHVKLLPGPALPRVGMYDIEPVTPDYLKAGDPFIEMAGECFLLTMKAAEQLAGGLAWYEGCDVYPEGAFCVEAAECPDCDGSGVVETPYYAGHGQDGYHSRYCQTCGGRD